MDLVADLLARTKALLRWAVERQLFRVETVKHQLMGQRGRRLALIARAVAVVAVAPTTQVLVTLGALVDLLPAAEAVAVRPPLPEAAA